MCTSSVACPSLSLTLAVLAPRLRNIVIAAEASTTIKRRYSASRGSSASRILRMVASGGSSTSTGSSFATRSSHSFMVGFAATCSISPRAGSQRASCQAARRGPSTSCATCRERCRFGSFWTCKLEVHVYPTCDPSDARMGLALSEREVCRTLASLMRTWAHRRRGG